MALQVWLPLNGNLNNQGLFSKSWSVSNSTTITVNNAGKIGKCYNFSGSTGNGIIYGSDLNTFFSTLIDGKPWTVSIWVNPDYSSITSNPVWFFGYGIIFRASNNSNNCRFSLWAKDPNGTNHGKTLYIPAIPGNTWSHVTLTRDTVNNKFVAYINGSQVAEIAWFENQTFEAYWKNAVTLGRDLNNSTSSDFFQGKINDFRIYDECLSAAQIKEISKGLVLHYKFDDPYIEGTTNYLGNRSNNFTNWSSFGFGQNGSLTQLDSNPSPAINGKTAKVTKVANNSSGQTEMATWCTISLATNNVCCFSAYVKGSSNTVGRSGLLHIYGSDGTTQKSNTVVNFTFTDEWQRVNGTFKWTGTNTISTIAVYVVGNGMALNDYYYFSNCQVEKKDHATPWTESTRTTTVIEDCSDYGYNGSIGGALSVQTDTPRYDYSTTGFTYSSNPPTIIERESPSTEVKTICFWIKSAFTNSRIAFVDIGSHLSFGFYNNRILLGYGTASDLPLKTIYTAENYSSSAWNFISIVKQPSMIELYINGNKQTADTGENYWTAHTSALHIGNRRYDDNFTGSLSDFRMYATALSENDIKELYKTSAKIDDKGNLLTYEIVEE